MLKVYGYSDDVICIEGAAHPDNEIGCYDEDVRLWFSDGTRAMVHYGKPGIGGVWSITLERRGTANPILTQCDDEDAEVYSDILEIDALLTACEKHEARREVLP